MQVIEWSQFIEEALPLGGNPSAITVGVFDGVHRGHKVLIEQVVSQKKHATPIVVCFKQSHYKKKIMDRQDYPGDILTFRQKMAVFESLGISITVVIEFSESFRQTSGAAFLQTLREHGKMNYMAVGSNFRCGYKLDTDALSIQKINAEFDILTCIVKSLAEGNQPISSSLIRAAIAQGKLDEASAMLGRPFIVDLFGASVSHTAFGAAYDINGRGGILPPPGRYQVLLLEKNCDEIAGRPADIIVENGSVIIAEKFTAICPEYVKF